jgi:hypothetical protein
VPEEIMDVVESDNIRKLKCNLSDFRKREVDGLYHPPQQLKGGQFGFDTSFSLSVRILYTTIICDDFGLLETQNIRRIAKS